MLLIREVVYCRPGKVRPMVEKFRAMKALGEKKGWGPMRIMTDVAAERYWTVVAEFDVPNMETFTKMAEDSDPAFGEIMKDYHDLVDVGRREIYTLEG